MKSIVGIVIHASLGFLLISWTIIYVVTVENDKFSGWGFGNGFDKSNVGTAQKTSVWGDAFGNSTSSQPATTTTTTAKQDVWSSGFSSETTPSTNGELV